MERLCAFCTQGNLEACWFKQVSDVIGATSTLTPEEKHALIADCRNIARSELYCIDPNYQITFDGMKNL